MKVVDVNVLESEGVISEIIANHPVVLVGSAISIWDPTCLPGGLEIMKDMFYLFISAQFPGIDSSSMGLLHNLWATLPFEHMLEKCPNRKKLTQIIKKNFMVENYNPIHEAIANGLVDGKFRGVITTNYDLCLDNILLPYKDIQRVVADNDFQPELSANKRYYFKIHGSADDSDGKTLRYALIHETYLEDWKRKLLSHMVNGQSLLIIGYSGMDFEICPEIRNISVKNIYWNIMDQDSMTQNAHRFLKTQEGYFLCGDMRRLLWNCSCLGGPEESTKILFYAQQIDTTNEPQRDLGLKAG